MRKAPIVGLAIACALAAGLGLPESASACAVCYGASDSLMTKGMNNGILTLLAVVAVVQGGLVALFVALWQRARRLRQRREQFHLIDGGVG